METVLFVDTDGSRSLMAAAIVRAHAPDRFEAVPWAAKPQPVDERVLSVLREHEVDPTGLVVRSLDSVPYRGQKIVIRELSRKYAFSLDEAVETEQWMARHLLSWPIPDPKATDTLEAFEQARDQLEGLIFDWLNKFEERFDSEPEVPPHHLTANLHRPA